MSLFVVVLLFSCFFISTVWSAVPADEVTSLPGWTGPLPSKHYSGFFSVANKTGGNGGYLHYWLALSENNPTTDPLVVWLQGGPGCSSLFGLLYENGPLHFSGTNDTTGLPTLVYNPQTWTSVANMLWLEQPVGVGFSYCAQGTQCNGQFQDDAYGFFVNFFAAYPEFSKTKLYISGESYAGVYVPFIADAILTGNAGGQNPQINLVAILVGNGLGGDYPGNWQTQRDSDFFYGHMMFPYESQQQINWNCNFNGTLSSACQNALNEAEGHIGSFYVYNVYDTCPHDLAVKISDLDLEKNPHLPLFAPIRQNLLNHYNELGFICILESVSSTYLDTPSVQQSLHVTIANVSQWEICGAFDDVNARLLQKHRSAMEFVGMMQPNQDLGALYMKLINEIPVLIYSGDVDQCVPTDYSDGWVKALGFKVVTNWQPWTYNYGPNNLQVGGYVTTFSNANITFLTVKNSGHMVPQYQPTAALTMFTNFLQGIPFSN